MQFYMYWEWENRNNSMIVRIVLYTYIPYIMAWYYFLIVFSSSWVNYARGGLVVW